MIITARQLDDLHKSNGSNGHVLLPYRARLSPLAADWVRARNIAVGYGDAEAGKASAAVQDGAKAAGDPAAVSPGASTAPPAPAPASAAAASNTVLWWCDGPCGPAKAAIVEQAKESTLRPIELPSDPKRVAAAIKAIAGAVKSNPSTTLGLLVVQNAAAAVVFANRCPSLRAVVGTSLEAVEQGIQQVAANVLVIEHPRATLQQVKNLLGRFARAKRELSEDVRRQLQELASCG